MWKRKSIFTLIELLVVTSIIAILSALLLPALGRAKAYARSILCATNLKSCGTGMEFYLNDWNDRFPQFNGNGGYAYPQAIVANNLNQQKFGSAFVLFCPEDKRSDTTGAIGPVDKSGGWQSGPWGAWLATSYGASDSIFRTNATAQECWYLQRSKVKYPATTSTFTDCYSHSFGLWNQTIQTRHLGSANFVFVDGHVESYKFKGVGSADVTVSTVPAAQFPLVWDSFPWGPSYHY